MIETNIQENPTALQASQALIKLASAIESGQLVIRRLSMFKAGDAAFDLTMIGHIAPQRQIATAAAGCDVCHGHGELDYHGKNTRCHVCGGTGRAGLTRRQAAD